MYTYAIHRAICVLWMWGALETFISSEMFLIFGGGDAEGSPFKKYWYFCTREEWLLQFFATSYLSAKPHSTQTHILLIGHKVFSSYACKKNTIKKKYCGTHFWASIFQAGGFRFYFSGAIKHRILCAFCTLIHFIAVFQFRESKMGFPRLVELWFPSPWRVGCEWWEL